MIGKEKNKGSPIVGPGYAGFLLELFAQGRSPRHEEIPVGYRRALVAGTSAYLTPNWSGMEVLVGFSVTYFLDSAFHSYLQRVQTINMLLPRTNLPLLSVKL